MTAALLALADRSPLALDRIGMPDQSADYTSRYDVRRGVADPNADDDRPAGEAMRVALLNLIQSLGYDPDDYLD